jgi:Ca2+-dependent lipid-binding protein
LIALIKLYFIFLEKQQPAARGQQQKQPEQEMEVDEEEGEEDDQDEQEEERESEEEDEAEEEDDDDDIIVIDGEDDGIKIEQQQQEDKPKGSKEKPSETPQGNEANPRVETAKEKLQKSQAKAYYEWMAGFEANQIESTIKDLDTDSVLEMVRIADQEIRQHPEKFILNYLICKYIFSFYSFIIDSICGFLGSNVPFRNV